MPTKTPLFTYELANVFYKLENEGQGRDDLDENWQAMIPYHLAYVFKIGASRSSRCSRYIIVHLIIGRTDVRMNI